MKNPISVGVWDYGMGTDRYVGDGYKERLGFLDRVKRIGALHGVSGIEITYPNDVNENNWAQVKPVLQEYGLAIAGMGVELVCDKEWKDGSLSSANSVQRQKAIDLVKSAMDFAHSIGVAVISLWMGQDGFDYVFQNDYAAGYARLIDALRVCAQHDPSIKLGIEYKTSEPKMSCMMKNAGMALAAAQATGCANVGVTLDVGHAFNAGENPAESAAILMHEKRLFHLHLNDNYRIADDDMPVGSVHWPQYFELLYWLDRLGYDGWFSLDLYPYRDCPDAACRASIAFIEGASRFVTERLPETFAGDVNRTPGSILEELMSRFFAAEGGRV